MNLATRLVLLIHHRELKRPSNTGRLAHLMLTNSEVRVRGIKDQEMPTEGLVQPDYQSIVLYNSAETPVLSEEQVKSFGLPICLIVPDGNWRQASKMPDRISQIRNLPRFKLPAGKPTEYQLRLETKNEGLATFEAIARAMGIIEGSEVQDQMEKIFKLKVQRTLYARGKITDAQLSKLPIS